jgi:deoxycytidine triphosphate deaminase
MVDLTTSHPLLGSGVLSDRGIARAVESGRISLDKELEDSQLQPNSLDVRIGRVQVWDFHEIAKHRQWIYGVPAEDSLIPREPDPNPPTAEYPDEKGIPIVIPPGARAEITFHERLEYDMQELELGIDLRSGRGRLGLRLLSEIVKTHGEIVVPLVNRNPNPIVLYGVDRFAQLFFFCKEGDGRVVANPDEVKEIAGRISDTPIETKGPYLMFRAGEVAYTFREGIGPIDTRRNYTLEELFEAHSLPFLVDTFVPVLIPLQPGVRVPQDMGISLLHVIPFMHKSMITPDETRMFLEGQTVAAGWVDSGYEGTLSAQAMRLKFPGFLTPGACIAFGFAYKYDEPVSRPYGTVNNTPRERLYGSKAMD